MSNIVKTLHTLGWNNSYKSNVGIILVTAGIAALLNKIGRPEVAVGVYGSLYRFHSYFHDLMEERVKQLVKPGVNVRFRI